MLWGLVEYDKLSKDRVEEGYQFRDLYGNYIHKLKWVWFVEILIWSKITTCKRSSQAYAENSEL